MKLKKLFSELSHDFFLQLILNIFSDYYFHILCTFTTYAMARPIWTPAERVGFISER